MSMINFNELFIVKYKNKKNESIYYFQPRLLFEGKNLCYFDVIENNIHEDIFDKCNDNQEYDCFQDVFFYNSVMYEAFKPLIAQECDTHIDQFLEMIQIMGISPFFGFWLDFINEKSILSNALDDMKRENNSIEVALLKVVDESHSNQLFATEMTNMFIQNLIKILFQTEYKYANFFDISQQEYLGELEKYQGHDKSKRAYSINLQQICFLGMDFK